MPCQLAYLALAGPRTVARAYDPAAPPAVEKTQTVQATLAFPEEGRVAGNASCNRFTGTVTLRGDSIAFGPLATTKMACPPAVDEQERRHLAALQDASRVAMEGPYLLLYTKSGGAPLKYTKKSP